MLPPLLPSSNSFFYEEITLPIKLTDEQRTDRQERNAEIDLDLAKAADKLAQAKALFKSETEKIKEEKKKLLGELRQGYVDTLVECAEFPDEDRGIVSYMNKEGQEIHTRDMTPKEKRQYRIKFNQSTI